MKPDFEELASGFGLLEAPILDPEGRIVFSDVTGGGIWRLEKDDVVELFPHRRGIGGMAAHVRAGFVVSGRNVAYKVADRASRVLIEGNPWGYNDMVPDLEGRLYVGTFGFNALKNHPANPPSGSLLLIDLDGAYVEVDDDVLLSNGIGISPDARTLYLCDSGRKTIYSYRIASDGMLTDKRSFASVNEGILDGLAVGEDGSLWVAVYGTGQILVFDPKGRERELLKIPARNVSSLCFGGHDLRDLYITVGPEEGVNQGGLYRTQVRVQGLPVSLTRVPNVKDAAIL